MGTYFRAAIGVCTAHRPELLQCCLAALAGQTVPEGCDLTLIIADNEPEPNNRQAVAEFAASCPFPVKYVHEPDRGISRARNAVLDACEDRFDWIAFTDDDCRPESDWIAALLAAAGRHGADVIYGRREWRPPQPVPFWYQPPERNGRTEGQVLEFAATHNVLMAGELAGLRFRERRVGLRFDEHLAHGEDTDFFYRAVMRYGARIVYSAAPVVHETVPPYRATLRYQTVRAFYYAASRTHFHRRYKGFDGAAAKVLVRLVWQVPISIGRLIAAPIAWPFSEALFKRWVLKGVGRLAGAGGAIAGLAGFSGDPYG
jgi:succinoglycan biosynthesis protein ExoM